MASAAYIGLAVTSRDDSSACRCCVHELPDWRLVSLRHLVFRRRGRTGHRQSGESRVCHRSRWNVHRDWRRRDIWDYSDQFQFVSQPLQGDVEIIARDSIASKCRCVVEGGRDDSGNTRGCLPLRLNDGDGHAGWGFQRRIATGGIGNYQQGPRRRRSRVDSSCSGGESFQRLSLQGRNELDADRPDTITMASTVYVGLAVTSHNASATATAAFTNVTARSRGGGSEPAPECFDHVTLLRAPPTPRRHRNHRRPRRVTATAQCLKVDFYRARPSSSDTTSPYSVTWGNAPAGTYPLRAVARDNAVRPARRRRCR